MHKPREIQWKATLKILTYIKRSPGKSLLYKYRYMRIEDFSDSNYARDKRDRKSTSNYCTYIGGNLVILSKKKSVGSPFSIEAEYKAMVH